MRKDDPEFIKHAMEEFEEGVSAQHIRGEYTPSEPKEEITVPSQKSQPISMTDMA